MFPSYGQVNIHVWSVKSTEGCCSTCSTSSLASRRTGTRDVSEDDVDDVDDEVGRVWGGTGSCRGEPSSLKVTAMSGEAVAKLTELWVLATGNVKWEISSSNRLCECIHNNRCTVGVTSLCVSPQYNGEFKVQRVHISLHLFQCWGALSLDHLYRSSKGRRTHT